MLNKWRDDMASAHDVAAYALEQLGTITALKLQKLVYYCQAWSLVWDEQPLFAERIEAWANGPVVRSLYAHHRQQFELSSWSWGSSANLTANQKDTIDKVLAHYGDKTSQWLSDLTHKEAPWQQARRGLSDAERGRSEITQASMAEYYSGLASSHQP
jgi:uncharacterized phage-associated protein